MPNISKSKDNQKMKFQTLFCFLKKLYMRYKQVVSIFVSIYFGSPWLRHTIKTNFIKFNTVDLELCSILSLRKGLRTSFSSTFCMQFLKRIHSLCYLLLATVFIWFPVDKIINFGINHSFFFQAVFQNYQKS